MSLQAALDAYKRQDFATARQLLNPILAAEPDNEHAWTLQMYVAANESEQRDALQKVLSLNPNNQYALEMQAKLGGNLPAPPSAPTESRDDDGNVYEMMWDCKFCGTAKLLGVTHRYCPNCGSAQDAEKRYFPSDAEKVAVKDHEYVGADKVCEACDTPNAGNAEFCTNCGSPLSEEARAKKLASELRAEDAAFERSNAKDQAKRAQELAERDAEQAAKGSKTKWIIIGVVAVILALIAVFIFWTKEVGVVTTGHAWERSIEIEDYNARRKGSWCDNVPSDAYNISETRKVRSHKQIPDGQECSTRRIDQGDGTYREQQECRTKYREEPVYDDYCNYLVNRWEYKRSVEVQGNNKQPYWPRYQLTCEGQRKGCEKESRRQETYILLLENIESKEQYECDVDKKRWENALLKSKWKLNVSGITGGARCSSLQPL